MKRIAFLFAVLISFAAYSQDTQKVGYADTEYILSQMPDAKKVEADLQTHGAQLEAQLKAKAAEFEKKLADYNQNREKMIEAVRADRESELQRLQQEFQRFQGDAETSFQKKQQELMGPLYTKVGDAITTVAKENGYAFIITLTAAGGGGNVLLYKDPQFNISDLVLKKFGITPTAPAATKPQPK